MRTHLIRRRMRVELCERVSGRFVEKFRYYANAYEWCDRLIVGTFGHGASHKAWKFMTGLVLALASNPEYG